MAGGFTLKLSMRIGLLKDSPETCYIDVPELAQVSDLCLFVTKPSFRLPPDPYIEYKKHEH
jgi:hypothetical protein